MGNKAETRMNGVNIEKKCTYCNEFKVLVDFPFLAAGLYNTHSRCRNCINKLRNDSRDPEKQSEYDKIRYQKNKEKWNYDRRTRALLEKYNLTRDEFNKLAKDGCFNCGSFERLHVDHDHSTNVIRGILCHKCNIALGCLDEDVTKILGLIHYLENWKGRKVSLAMEPSYEEVPEE